MVDENGVVLFAPNLGWEMVDLRSILESTFAVPVTIDNEANAGAQESLISERPGACATCCISVQVQGSDRELSSGRTVQGRPRICRRNRAYDH